MMPPKLSQFGLLTILSICTQTPSVAASNKVDGHWSPWSVSPCTKTCNNGTMRSVRTCRNPAPQGGGARCKLDNGKGPSDDGLEWKVEACNEVSCFADKWTDWDDCGYCLLGYHSRYALCGVNVRCTGGQERTDTQKCSTWNIHTCPDPCLKRECPEFARCNNTSTELEPLTECVCVLGYNMNQEKTACIKLPPKPPTPRPIPVLPKAQKTVATVVSKTASTLLIVFVALTLVLFALLRVNTPDRIIQMNMEISLVIAHIFLVLPPTTVDNVEFCRAVSIAIHFFFTACYIFIMLEALHMYSLVAFVVKQDGMFSRFQNTLIGWCMAGIIVIFSVCFQFDNYGGKYHCWLRMDTPLLYAQLIPIVIIVTITITLIEAAGSSNYKALKGYDTKQRMSAKISQRTNLIILPLMIAHWILGMLAEYEQNLPLYGTFSVVNGVFGITVFFLHCTNNQQVRDKLKNCFSSVRGRK